MVSGEARSQKNSRSFVYMRVLIIKITSQAIEKN